MKIRTFVGVGITALACALALGLAPQSEKPAPQTESTKGHKFSVDDVHSSLIFGIKHMDLCNFYGRFNDLDGHFVLDMDNPEASSFDVKVKMNSVDTGNTGRDKHLKSPDFFNAAEFEHMSFKSTKVSKSADNTLQVTGDLTLHGVTREVVLDVEGPTPYVKDMRGDTRAGLSATTKLKRKDFGIVWNKAMNGGGVVVGDDIDVAIEVEGVRRDGAAGG